MTTFLSYSRANSDFAVQLAKDLKTAGHDVWCDQLSIPTGARWDDEIEKALHACSAFLLILSPASMQSQNVKDEVGYAIDHSKRILPALIEPCDIPFRLRRFQFVNFTDKSYAESLTEIRELLSRAAESQPVHESAAVKIQPAPKPTPAPVKAPAKESTSIGGDQNIMQGNFSGGIVVQGRNATVTAHQYSGVDGRELTALFEKIYKHIESRPPDPNVDKAEIIETIQKIEEEAEKGNDANEKKLGRWVETLSEIAPDIIDVALASLGGPVSGFTAVFKKIADRAKAQSKA